MSAPPLPAWQEAPAADAPKRLMLAKVTTVDQRRFEHRERFASTFDAYDAMLERYPHADRIEVRPLADVLPLPTIAGGARHAA